VLVETYEAYGDRVLRLLAQEERVPAFRLIITGTGRAYHYEWVDRIFAPLLERSSRRDRERMRTQIIATCDAYVWKVLRRDLEMSSEETVRAVTLMLSALKLIATAKWMLQSHATVWTRFRFWPFETCRRTLQMSAHWGRPEEAE
jgi:hypothetical protein